MERSIHYDRNVATFRALQGAGANTNKFHCIQHHLYCYSNESFELVALLGQRQGFEVAHAGKHKEEDALWPLDLTMSSLALIGEIEKQSLKVAEIAERAAADYDGWGTEVPPINGASSNDA